VALGHEDGDDALTPEFCEVLPVAQYLAEAEPELLFLVGVGDAPDFRHVDDPAVLPRQVEARFRRLSGARFDPGVAQYGSEIVLADGRPWV
jgi:hypothetical protein